MKKRTWHSGPPPHVGWWNASRCRQLTSWRWWNGMNWSEAAFSVDNRRHAAIYARFKVFDQKDIEWTYYYPKNARVPRIKPK